LERFLESELWTNRSIAEKPLIGLQSLILG